MIPVMIQDYIDKISDKTIHHERRQFFYSTLVNIRTAIDKAIMNYEKEKAFRK